MNPLLRRPEPHELRQPLLLAIVTAVLVAAVAFVALMSATPTWQSTAVLSLDQPRAVIAADDAGLLNKLSRLRFKYIGLIGTDRVAVPVAARLKVPVEDVRGRLSGEARLEDLLLRTNGTGTSKKQAQQTADALAAQVQAEVAAEQKAAAIPAVDQVQVIVVQAAADAEKIAPGRKRALAEALLAGVLVGVAVGLGLLLRRRTRQG